MYKFFRFVDSSFHRIFGRLLLLSLICHLLIGVAHAAPGPLLWKVEDKDSTGQVYLFGSLHYGAAEFYPLSPVIQEAFRSSDTLAVELDIDKLPADQLQKALQQKGFYSGERRLQDQLDKKSWKALVKVCQNLSIDCQQFLQTKPWLAAMQLTNLQLARSKYQQSLRLDKYFLLEARNKKTIEELETLDEQLRLLRN